MLEVSLRKAGFSVTPAVSVADALEKLEASPPDLIISETKFSTDLDGFELRRRLRGTPAWAEIPFIFLTAETAIENKIKGLELGVDDYLTKPIYIKEIVTRINILLQKKQRQFLDLRKDGTRFAGRVADMPVVDVIQTIEVSRKSGVIQFNGPGNRQAAIYFRDGKVIDAEAGTLQGEDAVYRLLTWSEGEFEVEFRTVRRREVIETSSQGLLMEGMRRLDEWSRLLEQLPPLAHRFEIDAGELALRLGEVPDDNNRILRLFDGKRTLLEVIDASDFGDLECLQAISRLYFEGLLIDLDPGVRTERVTGKPMPLVQVDDGHRSSPQIHAPAEQTPIQAASSGAIDLVALEARASQPAIAVPPATEPSSPVSAQDSTHSEPIPRNEPDATSEPLVSPSELAAEMPRAKRDSTQQINDADVVAEEQVHGPLSGNYRPSTLRLIDEAVAAAQLIEPSLFSDDELAAAGVKRATPEEVAAAKNDLATRDPRESVPPPTSTAPAAPTNGASNGRRNKTLPPPLPVKLAAKAAKDADEPPMLDSSLLTSGEHRIPTDQELADEAEMLDSSLLTSGEIKIPSEAALSGGSAKPPAPPPPAQLRPTATMTAVEVEPEDYSGVPTIIEAEKDNAPEFTDDRETDPSRRRPAAVVRDDAGAAAKMIGSLGRDRAEAHGELREHEAKAGETRQTQRELITIMPRRKTGEVTQLKPEDVSTADARGPAQRAVAAADAAKAEEAAKAEADKVKSDAKPEEVSPKPLSRPAVEPPASPPRRVTVEGGTAAPERGPGRGAQILIALASILAGAAVYSYCRKPSTTRQPVASTFEDAGVGSSAVVMNEQPDAPTYYGFGIDAATGMAGDHKDAGTRQRDAAMRPDAAEQVAMTTPDAAVTPRPDAAVAVTPRPDAATVANNPPTGDGSGSSAPTGGKDAATLAKQAREAMSEGEMQKAADLFEQSLKLKKDKKVYVDRGKALAGLGKTDEAVASYKAAIAMSEGYLPAWEAMGNTLWSAQKYDDARPVLEKYLELAPDGPSANKFRGWLDTPK